MAALVGLTVAADPAAWRDAGFAVAGDECQVGGVVVRLAGAAAGRGIVGWEVSGLMSTELDGLPTGVASGAPAPSAPDAHPNGAVGLDHVVVSTPDLDRTLAALEAAGLELRRVREAGTPEAPLRQGFFRVGEAILEVVGPSSEDPAGPARFWGLMVVVEDLDACAALLGDRLGSPRDAVQPGRRIATVRREAGLGTRVALMTPRPEREPPPAVPRVP